MKRLFLYLFLIFFILHNPSRANDIRDFQIEGISLWDSALDYLSKEQIEYDKQSKSPYKNDDFFISILDLENSVSTTYDFIRFHLRKDDQTYKIYHVGGVITYRNEDFEECIKKKNEISSELVKLFGFDKKKEGKLSKHAYDKTGNSVTLSTYFNLNDGRVRIICINWSKELTNEKGWEDSLSVNIYSNEFRKWLNNTAYK